MNKQLDENIKKRFFWLYKFLTSRIVYHTGFWVTLFLLLMLLKKPMPNFWTNFLVQFGQVFFFIILVYVNIYVLVPRFLTKNKILAYLLNLVSLTIFVTLARIVYQYWVFTGYEDLQYDLLHESQIVLFILHFFVAIASTVFVISSQWVRNEREKTELRTQQMQTELKFLKSQINPHFLFNILNSLYALTLKKSDLAPEMVIKLSEMMRYMLYECNEKRVILEKELNYLKNYLDLERLRMGNRMDISFEIDGISDGKYIAPLIFINFVENSFKHGGINSANAKGYVSLKIEISPDSMIRFYLENSKQHRLADTKKLAVSGGIGLQNVKDRLDLVYGSNYKIDIIDTEHKYTVDLKLKLDSLNS